MIKHKKQFRVLILVGLFALTHTFGHAQKFYAGFSVGYGFPLAPQNIPKDWGDLFIEIGTGPGISNESLYDHAQHGTYGEGVSFKLHGGYFITENISTELEIGYLIGRSYTLTRSEINSNQSTFQSYKTGGNMLMLTPSVRYGILKGRFYPYMRVGLVVGVLTKLNFERHRESRVVGFPNSESVSRYELSGGAGVGVSFSLGTDFKVTDRMSVSLSLSALGMSYAPEKGELVKYDLNGENRLTTMSVKEKEISFQENAVLGGTTVGDEAREMPKIYFPFSSIEIRTGITYTFNANK